LGSIEPIRDRTKDSKGLIGEPELLPNKAPRIVIITRYLARLPFVNSRKILEFRTSIFTNTTLSKGNSFKVFKRNTLLRHSSYLLLYRPIRSKISITRITIPMAITKDTTGVRGTTFRAMLMIKECTLLIHLLITKFTTKALPAVQVSMVPHVSCPNTGVLHG